MNLPDLKRTVRFAWGRLAPECEVFPAERIRAALGGTLDGGVLEEWLEEAVAVDWGRSDAPQLAAFVEAVSAGRRRELGLYTTPPGVAEGLAAAGALEPGDVVVDLAAGTGELLAAAQRREPAVRLVAVEWCVSLAIATAVRLVSGGGEVDARVFCGDGLADGTAWANYAGESALVLLNPPYVREKGRAERFSELRAEHEHLDEWFGPRIDLAYLFAHRGLDYLGAGGRLSLLSSAYWLSATGARSLRRDLWARTRPVAFVRSPETRLFDDASGHHSLLSVFERVDDAEPFAAPPTAVSLESAPESWAETVAVAAGDEASGSLPPDASVTRPAEDVFREQGWSPFASGRDRRWGRRLEKRGTPLRELLDDRQGFVSGADRVTRRRLSKVDGEAGGLEPGDPGFLWDADELTERMQKLEGTVVRPVLRGSSLVPNTIRVTPPREHYVLFVDAELGDGQEWVVEHLRPLASALADRREVRRGRMPWYRLHWPRDRGEQVGPKLVVPRRAEQPRFALDLSASAVSSDCTYLVAPDDVEEPVAYLVELMLLLNRPATHRYLRNFGKRKGDILEFYSEPLQSLPLPVRRSDGTLEWVEELSAEEERRRIEEAVVRGLELLRSPPVASDGPLHLD